MHLLQLFRLDRSDDPYSFRSGVQSYGRLRRGLQLTQGALDWSDDFIAALQQLATGQGPQDQAARIGRRLRDFVSELGWPVDRITTDCATTSNSIVRVVLRFAAAELYSLPWELVPVQPGDKPLGALPNAVIHYVWPGIFRTTQPDSISGRVLLAWSVAGGGRVPVRGHVEALSATCPTGSSLSFDAQADVLDSVSPKRLQRALAQAHASGQPVTVLHILCHGRTDGDLFGLVWNQERSGSSGSTVFGEQLSRILAPFAHSLQLAVICACHGGHMGTLGNRVGGVAQAVHRLGVPWVIAPRVPLSSASSVNFVNSLFAGLGEQCSVESAFVAARNQLAASAGTEWANVQLYGHLLGRDDELEELYQQLGDEWARSDDFQALLTELDYRREPPRGARQGPAALHWLILSLASSGDLVRLDHLVRIVADHEDYAYWTPVLDSVRDAVAAREWPEQLDEVWMAVWRGPAGWKLDFQYALAQQEPVHGTVLAAAGRRTELADHTSVEVNFHRKRMTVRIIGALDGPLVGAGVRVWNGIKAVSSRLIPWTGDQLGDCEFVLFEGSLDVAE